MIRLQPMTAEELASWIELSISEYAQDNVRAGNWEERRAHDLSKAEHERLLPNGVNTPDQFLRTILDEDHGGRRVGEVWYALRKDRTRPQLFVYWVGVDEKFREKGIGTEVFRLLEDEARRLGAASIALAVFGDNVRAQALYRRLGYEPTQLLMAKTL